MTVETARQETERVIVQRIIAMLLSLADLAEQAAGQSRQARRHVLGILAIAEGCVRQFIIGYAPLDEAGLPYQSTGVVGDTSADAMRLAACLRNLAVILAELLMLGAFDDCPDDAEPVAGRRPCLMLQCLAETVRALALPFHDTS